MKVLRLLVALSFASLFAHAAAADSTDPVIGFGGGGSISETCGTTVEVGDGGTACGLSGGTVTATLSNGETGGIVDIANDLGVDVLSLTITDNNLPAGDTLTCENYTVVDGYEEADPYFGMVTQTAPNSCTYSGVAGDDLPVGAVGGIYTADFAANSMIDLVVSTPEPSSMPMLLLGIGLLSVFATGKWRGAARSEA